MKTTKTTLTTEAVFSEDESKRYLLRKVWDTKKPKLAIILLAPSSADGIQLDSTTLLVLNNADRLGYGSVDIVNLFATLNDVSLKSAEDEDSENVKYILSAAENADDVIYAPGVGKASNKTFQSRQEQILKALLPYKGKLRCLCDATGKAKFQHPLAPAVRTWYLSEFKFKDVMNNIPAAKKTVKKEKEVKDEN